MIKRYPAELADTLDEMDRLTQLGSTASTALPAMSETASPYLNFPYEPQISRAQRRVEASDARKSQKDGWGRIRNKIRSRK